MVKNCNRIKTIIIFYLNNLNYLGIKNLTKIAKIFCIIRKGLISENKLMFVFIFLAQKFLIYIFNQNLNEHIRFYFNKTCYFLDIFN